MIDSVTQVIRRRLTGPGRHRAGDRRIERPAATGQEADGTDTVFLGLPLCYEDEPLYGGGR